MFNRFNEWRQLGMMLIILWTIAAMTSGWLNLPRAPHIAPDPQFVDRLSSEASDILRGSDAAKKPAPGELLWLENPRTMRMPNGVQLTFPTATTDERAAFVAAEYRELLNVEADRQTGPYLLQLLALWLAPVLLGGLAALLTGRGFQPALRSAIPRGAH